ncbi:hypothetical protein EJB05_28898, partial [Eragrostis curvula]
LYTQIYVATPICRYDAASASARDIADPGGAIRAALAEALINCYPLAGRLLELLEAGGKLLVNCTAEGVVFVEADADVRLEDLGQALAPSYPCVEELLCCNTGEPEESVIGKPLIFFPGISFLRYLGFRLVCVWLPVTSIWVSFGFVFSHDESGERDGDGSEFTSVAYPSGMVIGGGICDSFKFSFFP